ncbi:MAG: hypothetical protein PVH29_03770 [Candidatus Zixiibacteriota bacterium]|jgi:hypothetical protein
MKKFLIVACVLLFVGVGRAQVLIWDHDNGQTFKKPTSDEPVGTEAAIAEALAANGVTDVQKKNFLPYDLSGYEAVFVLCGFWPDDGTLTYTEQGILAAYLAGGGNLYIEGTELARRYGYSALFDMMGATFADDGRTMGEGNVNVAEGIGPWAGIRLDYYSYQKDGPDAFVDELLATSGEAVVRSRRAGNKSNARVVRRAGESEPAYRSLVSSFIFGALADGEHKKSDLMAIYLEYFGLSGNHNNIGIAPASLGRVRALFR